MINEEMEERYRNVAKFIAYYPETGKFTKLLKISGRVKEVGSVTSQGYMEISHRGEAISLHRLAFYIMEGRLPVEIDHKDRDRGNNKWDNLWECTHKENMNNRSKFRPRENWTLPMYRENADGTYRYVRPTHGGSTFFWRFSYKRQQHGKSGFYSAKEAYESVKAYIDAKNYL